MIPLDVDLFLGRLLIIGFAYFLGEFVGNLIFEAIQKRKSKNDNR